MMVPENGKLCQEEKYDIRFLDSNDLPNGRVGSEMQP